MDGYSDLDFFTDMIEKYKKSSMAEGTDGKHNLSGYDVDVNNPMVIEIEMKLYLFYPMGTFVNLWNLLVMTCMAWLLLILPITLSQPSIENYNIRATNNISNLIFIVDIFVNFNTAFYDDYYNIVDSRASIAYNYLSSWFLIDFISSVPLNLILPLITSDIANPNLNGVIKFLRVPRYFRILKIARMSKLYKSVENSIVYKNIENDLGEMFNSVIGMIKTSIMLLLSCHLMSCAMVWLTKSSDPNWWTVYNADGNLNLLDQYTAAWYLAIMTVTTVGYGDVSNKTIGDMIFKMICMLIGVVIFTFFLTSVMEMLQEPAKNVHDQSLKDRLDLMKYRYRIGGRCSFHLEALMQKNKRIMLVEEYDLVFKLNDDYKRNEVYQSIKDSLTNYISIFEEWSLELFKDLFKKMIIVTYVEQDQIVVKETKAENMYFVNYGKIAYTEDILNKYKILHSGKYQIKEIGEEICFEDCIIFSYYLTDLYAHEHTEVFVIKKSDMIHIIDQHDILESIMKICKREMFLFYQAKFATVLILQHLIEMGMHISRYDIEAYIEKYDLSMDTNMFLNFKYLKHFKQRKSYWWDPILNSSDLSYVINHHAKKYTTLAISHFNRAFQRMKRSGSIIDQNQFYKFMHTDDVQFESEDAKEFQKKLNIIEHEKNQERAKLLDLYRQTELVNRANDKAIDLNKLTSYHFSAHDVEQNHRVLKITDGILKYTRINENEEKLEADKLQKELKEIQKDQIKHNEHTNSKYLHEQNLTGYRVKSEAYTDKDGKLDYEDNITIKSPLGFIEIDHTKAKGSEFNRKHLQGQSYGHSCTVNSTFDSNGNLNGHSVNGHSLSNSNQSNNQANGNVQVNRNVRRTIPQGEFEPKNSNLLAFDSEIPQGINFKFGGPKLKGFVKNGIANTLQNKLNQTNNF